MFSFASIELVDERSRTPRPSLGNQARVHLFSTRNRRRRYFRLPAVVPRSISTSNCYHGPSCPSTPEPQRPQREGHRQRKLPTWCLHGRRLRNATIDVARLSAIGLTIECQRTSCNALLGGRLARAYVITKYFRLLHFVNAVSGTRHSYGARPGIEVKKEAVRWSAFAFSEPCRRTLRTSSDTTDIVRDVRRCPQTDPAGRTSPSL